MRRWLYLCLALVLFGSSVSNAQQEYNITVTDQSPMMIYAPTRESWNSTVPGSVRDADDFYNTSHTTNIVGATATIKWFGTAMWFWGNVEGSVRLLVDNVTVNQEAGLVDVMACAVDLPNKWHVATLIVVSGSVEVWNASFTVVDGTNATTVNNQTIDAVAGTSISTSLDTTQGSWVAANCTIINGQLTSSNSSKWTYDFVETTTPYSSLNFAPPKNTSFVTVFGTVGPYHGNFSVALSTGGTYSGPTPANQTFNAFSPYASAGEVLYYASLDPSLLYMVTIESLSSTWDIMSTEYTTLSAVTPSNPDNSNPSSSSSTNIGAIVGGVVGGVVALAALGILVWWLLRRRRQKQSPVQREDFRVDDGSDPALGSRMTPFYENIVPAPVDEPSIRSGSMSPLVTVQSQSQLGTSDTRSITSSNPSDTTGRTPRSAPSGPRPQLKSNLSLSSGGEVLVRQELDAGRIEEEVMPPSYNAAWADNEVR